MTKEIIWIEKRNTRYEQASFTWLAYQFTGDTLAENYNLTTIGKLGILFVCYDTTVQKLWRKLCF